jgi:hypothetical protein
MASVTPAPNGISALTRVAAPVDLARSVFASRTATRQLHA